MKITVKFLSPLGSRLGREEDHIECAPATKVCDLLRILGKNLGEEFFQMIYEPDSERMKAAIAIGIRRENVPGYQRLEMFDGMNTMLQPNDSLIVFLSMGGG